MASNNTDASIFVQGDPGARARTTDASNPIQGTSGADIIFGTDGNDDISALAGNDTIFGTRGADRVDGGAGRDTIDYSQLNAAITLLPRGGVGGDSSLGSQIISIERIVAASGQQNAIDASGASGDGASINANLTNNRLVVNIPGLGARTFTVENFVNVTGTSGNDTIVGNGANNTLSGSGGNDSLTGAGGSDTLSGGDGNDTLLGTNGTARGASERDVLNGGEGVDKFILGDRAGAFYKAAGNSDLAVIEDFSFGEQIQLGIGDTYNVQTKDSGFNIFVTTGGINELIADVTFGSSASNARAASPTFPEGNFTIASGQNVGGVFVGA